MEKEQLKEIGQRLRQRRTDMNLTREQFAELADIGAGYYGQIEVGTSQMSIDTLVKVSKTARLPMEYILFGTGYEPSNPDAVIDLLYQCSERELELAKKLLVLYLARPEV